ncbi:hypothetical protein MSAN_00140800 [Mycena sanguinolenta]|uniref:Uncharacterized protein n=1 Tax=Mycena sanguinolenta TaxID=230812 RepID=A0A8H6ZIZ5_9AGAR|nr:hypothetical protein MSAN_00140800 [Mycena sanguinolenta]
MADLPQELVDLVFDVTDASADLKSWTLVSHTFVLPGQRRLFRRLTLRTDTIVSLSKCIALSPRIGSYVSDLQLNFQDRFKFAEAQTSLAQAIRLLPKVDHVTISAPEYWSFWNACSTELQAEIISLLSLPTIHSLAFVRCYRVPAFLISRAIACYKEVVLQVKGIDAGLQAINFGIPRKSEPLNRLVLLDYSPAATPAVHALLLRPEAKAALGRLWHLKITLPLARDSLVIVSEYAAFLQHLTITFHRPGILLDPRSSRVLPLLNLPVLPQLRSLNLQPYVSSFAGIPDPLLLLVAGLPSLTPRLELLDITLTSVTARFTSAPYPSASAADEALMCLSHLRKVRFLVIFESLTAYRNVYVPHLDLTDTRSESFI